MLSCVDPVPIRVLSLRSKLSIAPFNGLVVSKTGGKGTLLSLAVVAIFSARSASIRFTGSPWWFSSVTVSNCALLQLL